MLRRFTILLSALLVLALITPGVQVGAAPRKAPPIRVRHISSDYTNPRMTIKNSRLNGPRARNQGPKVGANKTWLALDDVQGAPYLKNFKLRGLGKHIEVWVADDSDDVSTGLAFPAGDCRNDERIKITNKQVKYLIKEFDENIYPKESRIFSKPPDRDGSDARLYNPSVIQPPFPPNYYKGRGNRIVTLIDNVREDNFYDPNNSQNLAYIAGFFTSAFNELFDRNVMTIDAFDWLHRTRGKPPNEPVQGDNCASKPARPFLYESTFAHEYQHLLEYYQDANESTWVNEGLSDHAQTFTGYARPRRPITQLGFDGHTQAFLGFLEVLTDANPNPRVGGPENSLNLWEEQPGEVLSDYGASYTFMEFLKSRYGTKFMGKFHRNGLNSFESLETLLRKTKAKPTAREVLHDWSAMVALDGVLDDGASLEGAPAGRFKTKSLHASVNWDNDDTYALPGAPPNGADFVRLRDGDTYLSADDISSITFDGEDSLPPAPVEWVVDSEPPDRAKNAALYSGSGADLDRAIVAEVSVPANDPILRFENRYEIDDGFDFGFVQVSTDGGATYKSLANDHTVNDSDPGASVDVQDNLPGLTGNSGCPPGSQLGGSCQPSWVTETFDLSAYAGQDILLAFRYITDRSVNLEGWWIDEVSVGNKKVSQGTTINDWQSPTEVRPVPVEGFTVQLVAYDDAHTTAGYTVLTLVPGFTGGLEGTALAAFLPDNASTVAALVTYDESTEELTQYAPYTLQVNGQTQPGGR
ncbi:MAG TPA: peptidase M6 [Actinomycetota bacterium]|nr:peptidase M6 [Actinomycetota bacterium]